MRSRSTCMRCAASSAPISFIPCAALATACVPRAEPHVNSIRARLTLWLLVAVAVTGAIGAWLIYRNSLAEADTFFDYQLRQTALTLRDQAFEYAAAPALTPAEAGYDFVVQVWSFEGVRVYLSQPHVSLPGVDAARHFDRQHARRRLARVRDSCARRCDPGGATDACPPATGRAPGAAYAPALSHCCSRFSRPSSRSSCVVRSIRSSASPRRFARAPPRRSNLCRWRACLTTYVHWWRR